MVDEPNNISTEEDQPEESSIIKSDTTGEQTFTTSSLDNVKKEAKEIPDDLKIMFGNIDPSEIEKYCEPTAFTMLLTKCNDQEQNLKKQSRAIEDLNTKIIELSENKGEARESEKNSFFTTIISFLTGIIITLAFKLIDKESPYLNEKIGWVLFIIAILTGILLIISRSKYLSNLFKKKKNVS